MSEAPDTCPDCRAAEGQLHQRFCLQEGCPFCGGQLATCGCIRKVLTLTDEERRALDAYVDDGQDPLYGVVERWKAALDERGRVPFRDTRDRTMKLLEAASRGEIDAVRALLSSGMSPDAAAPNGGTALMAAARSYRVDAVELLLAARADVHRRTSDGFTALHAAVGEPSRTPDLQGQCVDLLLAHGAAADAKTNTGLTPLMNAAWVGCLPAVLSLLSAGASVSHRNVRGDTALDLARKRGHERIVEVLGSRG